MCGIAGLIDKTVFASEVERTCRRMTDAISHRGPDDSGIWGGSNDGVSLGHRRLSIIDLSPLGHQPMLSSCQRYVVVYNGEIYNYQILRRELEAAGRKFRGQSDTEVILEGAAVWGITGMVQKLCGMFAIALWDREARSLTLVRDRLGIKPLYWGHIGKRFVFGSELKAIKAAGTLEVDDSVFNDYLCWGYVPAPRSIYKSIHKLMPGQILNVRSDGSISEELYWSASDVAREGTIRRTAVSDQVATDHLEGLLKDVIAQHMLADVPLGAFLSGGIDSSLVAALMQKQSGQKIKTFTVGFEAAGFNEAGHAKAVAVHLGTEHTEMMVTAQQALDVIPHLQHWYDEPFADSSQIPTLLVSAMTRQHVTVALSGDGGDELFAGYERYQRTLALKKALLLPQPLRKFVCAIIGILPHDRLRKLCHLLSQSQSADDIFLHLVQLWPELGCSYDWPDFGNLLDKMQLTDLTTYLPDDILTKVDRASMAVALEARVPLLDHRVVEFAWSLPQHMKLRNGTSKWLLREVLYRYVPRELIDRPKQGFAVPLASWLRGPLKDWAEDLLQEDKLTGLDAAPILRKWAEHKSGRRNWPHQLWAVLMLQAWRTTAS